MMLPPKMWMEIHPEGLFCVPGQFYIDPHLPVDSAVITHAHSDHARVGHGKVLGTPSIINILKLRYGEQCATQLHSLSYHQEVLEKNVRMTFFPAGHILGSAQVLLEYQDIRIVVSGDYKRAPDPTCEPFEIIPCTIFITEATFGLPVFIHPPIKNEICKLLSSLQKNPEKCHLVGAYSLGKCQRVINALRHQGYHETIYLHGAQIKLCNLYQEEGIELGSLDSALALNQTNAAGKIVMCPPSALHDRWSRRFGDVIRAYASGWMRIRARARQRGIDLPLIISDHADWNELTQTLHEVNPTEIWVTHGREEALVFYAQQAGYKAKALSLLGYEQEYD